MQYLGHTGYLAHHQHTLGLSWKCNFRHSWLKQCPQGNNFRPEICRMTTYIITMRNKNAPLFDFVHVRTHIWPETDHLCTLGIPVHVDGLTALSPLTVDYSYSLVFKYHKYRVQTMSGHQKVTQNSVIQKVMILKKNLQKSSVSLVQMTQRKLIFPHSFVWCD